MSGWMPRPETGGVFVFAQSTLRYDPGMREFLYVTLYALFAIVISQEIRSPTTDVVLGVGLGALVIYFGIGFIGRWSAGDYAKRPPDAP